MDFKAELHRQLADLTTLVWLMQNTLAESDSITGELQVIAHRISYMSGIIEGHVARWALWEKEQVP
jgi:hypothetical protein